MNTYIITDSQYDFRKSHATEYLAIELVDRIMHALDKKKIPLNIHIDLSKAFDITIIHYLLNSPIMVYRTWH